MASVATKPATALARSSCAPGAWSMLSRPPRAVWRSSERNCATVPRMIKQINLAAVDLRQEVSVEIGFRLRGLLVIDLVLCELLDRPHTGIFAALNGRDAIRPQQRGEFSDHGLRQREPLRGHLARRNLGAEEFRPGKLCVTPSSRHCFPPRKRRAVRSWILQSRHRVPHFHVGDVQCVVLDGIFKIFVSDILDRALQCQFDLLDRD